MNTMFYFGLPLSRVMTLPQMGVSWFVWTEGRRLRWHQGDQQFAPTPRTTAICDLPLRNRITGYLEVSGHTRMNGSHANNVLCFTTFQSSMTGFFRWKNHNRAVRSTINSMTILNTLLQLLLSYSHSFHGSM